MVHCGVRFFFPSSGFQGLNSGHDAWQQVLPYLLSLLAQHSGSWSDWKFLPALSWVDQRWCTDSLATLQRTASSSSSSEVPALVIIRNKAFCHMLTLVS